MSDPINNPTNTGANPNSSIDEAPNTTRASTSGTDNQIAGETENPPPPAEAFLECRSRRDASEIQNISFTRIKKGLAKAQNPEWVQSMSKYEVRESIRMLTREFNNLVIAHYELYSLAMSKDARETQLKFFEEASAMYHESNEILRNRHIEIMDASPSSVEAKEEMLNDEPALGMSINIFKENRPRTPPPEPSDDYNLEMDGKFTMKTEPIKLPIFNGDKENWVLFREQFLTFVHNRKKISNAIKMQQLFSHLSEKALRAIRGITPVASNYERAWKVLNDRYNNNQILVNHHLKRFFNLAPITRDDPVRLLTLIDGANELINSLPGINEPMVTWDSILIFCVFNKLDHASQEAWQANCMTIDKPSFDQFLQFLERRAQTNAAATSTLLTPHNQKHEPQKKFIKRAGVYKASIAPSKPNWHCKLCGEEHPLYRCPKFRELSVKTRWHKAKEANVCYKCLAQHDPSKKCNFEKCPVCSKPHNRLLCYDDEKRRLEAADSSSLESAIQRASINHIVLQGQVAAVLGTAQVEVLNTFNDLSHIRCLCDSGSQLNLITEEAVRRLGMKPTRAKIQLNGIGDQFNGISTGMVDIQLGPNFGGNNTLEAPFFVVNKITMPLPVQQLPIEWLDNTAVGDLADPHFHIPARIDALLGVNIWAAIVQPGIRRVADNLIAQKTRFGWVLYGSLTPKHVMGLKRKAYVSATLTQEPVVEILNGITKFWEIHEPPKKKFRTAIEAKVEDHFMRTFYRSTNGRYGVRLPFNEKINLLGSSKESVKRQFLNLERRLEQNKELKARYIQFMREYIENGHMSLVEDSDEGYMTPHHCVFTDDKFRTVFNASFATQTGISLNDAQMVGEKLQADLSVQLMNFRRYPVAITADIKKMYRQVEVHPQDRKFQKIYWRESSDAPLLTYELNTVTYGQAAAPHCAVRALQQCAKDYESIYPLGAQQIQSCFYMDDYLGGADDIQSATIVRNQIENNLSKGGFELAKWCSNIRNIVPIDEDKQKKGIPCHDQEATSILGMHWMPESDLFTFNIASVDPRESWTMREIMSEAGKLYDPNGFAAPIVIIAKLVIQKIWKENGEWDKSVSQEIIDEWNSVLTILPHMNDITIPRWLNLTASTKCTLFGFCDASTMAYSAAIYMRVACMPKPSGELFNTLLVQSKTKVAPLKQQYTVPRLELLAAELLATLMENVKTIFSANVEDCLYWSDSQIALSWIRKEPALLKGLEANRVSIIRQRTNPLKWFYVPTYHNPADLATRAKNDFIRQHDFWFYGPQFIRHESCFWESFGINPYLPASKATMKMVQSAEKKPDPNELNIPDEVEQNIKNFEAQSLELFRKTKNQTPSICELFPDVSNEMTMEEIDEIITSSYQTELGTQPRPDLLCQEAVVNVLTAPPLEPLTRTILNARSRKTHVSTLLETYSDIDKMISVLCYARRAFRRNHMTGPITPLERNSARRFVIQEEQKTLMPGTIKSLRWNQPLYRERSFKDLSLFMDENDLLIHLSGRIQNNDLPYLTRNPIILPVESLFTRRLFEKAHLKTHHGGAQQMLAYVRQHFWVPKARILAKQVMHACVVCKRHSFRAPEQQMAPLPLSRTTPGRAFSSIGVDYCGPVYVKIKPGRTNVILKSYICVFICLVTRAVHLELVSDMTTQAFIAAFRRLVARRGQVKEIVSDHGSNFVGAHNEFKRLRALLSELSTYEFSSEFNLNWKFNTERASHHGGIFEAAVKSAKKHLVRVIGEQSLTFEEYSTILAQVEACLNSRPICKQSDDPDDLNPLTPAHFLIGEPIILFPGENLSNTRVSYLNRWELLQQMMQGFWKRWSDEYLNTLLNRPKWNRQTDNFQVGDLVIIKEDNLPPSRWRLGRIEQVIAGPDKLVRSVVLKTQFGHVRRPIVKLALLEREVDDQPDETSHAQVEDDHGTMSHDGSD